MKESCGHAAPVDFDGQAFGLPTNSTSAWITLRACGASRYPHDHKTGDEFASLKDTKEKAKQKIMGSEKRVQGRFS